MYFTTVALIVAVVSVGFIFWKWWKRSGKTASITAFAGGLIPEERVPVVVGIIAKLVGWAIVLLSISWIFPDFVTKYVAQGGPTWLLYFMLVGAGIVWISGTSSTARPIIASGLTLIAVGSAVIFTVITWIHGADRSRGENEATQRRAQAQIEQQQATAQAQVVARQRVTEAAGGEQCLNVVHKDQYFGTTPGESPVQNPDGKCYFEFTPPHHVCFYMEGKFTNERKGPFGGCAEAIPFTPNNVPRDIVRVWSAGQPFTADYTLRPRTTRHAVVQ